MNTAIYTDQRSANIGIGFATPINAIRDLLPQLQNGKVDPRRHRRHRLEGSPDGGNGEGVRPAEHQRRAHRTSVSPTGAADKAGIVPGDVVVEFNGKPVKDSDSLVAMVVNTKPGTTVPIVDLPQQPAQAAERHDRRARSRGRADAVGAADDAERAAAAADGHRLRHDARADHPGNRAAARPAGERRRRDRDRRRSQQPGGRRRRASRATSSSR